MNANSVITPINVTRSSMPPIEEYIEQIRGLWDTRWLTNRGALYGELTEKLKDYLAADNLLLFNNGHMALELGIQALGLQGEVVTTPFTFASTTQAIVRNGLTPVFCDIDPVRFTIDPSKIESLITKRTSAIVAVHVYGMPCDTVAIEDIAARYGLKVIYDAAHTFGTKWHGKGIAKYGDYSMFSFHATKVFHTIEGGGAVFRDTDLVEKLDHLLDFGLIPGGKDADQIGTNAKLSEFHCAMGLCNLLHIDGEIAKRRIVSQRYDKHLQAIKGLRLLPDLSGLTRNYAYYPVVFLDEFGKTRDEVADNLRRNGINARAYFSPLTSAMSCYDGMFARGATPIAEDTAKRVLCLPLFADMRPDEIDTVCDVLISK